MKTRSNIYEHETEKLLHFITSYHIFREEQLKHLFSKKEDILKTLLSKLQKQGRIVIDKDRKLIASSKEDLENIDFGMLAAIWVLIDFKSATVYHNVSDYPVKLCFYANDEEYEICYIGDGQEHLMNYAITGSSLTDNTNRFLIVDSEAQIPMLRIPGVFAFCTVSESGEVSYFRKK